MLLTYLMSPPLVSTECFKAEPTIARDGSLFPILSPQRALTFRTFLENLSYALGLRAAALGTRGGKHKGEASPMHGGERRNDLANRLSHSWMVAIIRNVSGCAMMVSISLVLRSVSRQQKASCPA